MIIYLTDERLIKVNFLSTIRLDDQRIVVTLGNFSNEFIFKKVGEYEKKPD